MSTTRIASPTTGAAARVGELADAEARVRAAENLSVARLTGLPGCPEHLPDLSPSGLGRRAGRERALRDAVRRTVPADADEALERDHLLERLDTSLDLLESGEEGAALNVLASPFQQVRRLLRAPEEGTGPAGRRDPQAWVDHLERLRELPEVLAGVADSLDTSLLMGVVAPASQVEVVAHQAVAEAAAAPGSVLAGSLPAALPGRLPHSLAVAVSQATEVARGACADFAAYLREELSPLAGRADGVGRERHALWARRHLGTRIDVAEAFGWAEDQLAGVESAQDALAREVLGDGSRAADLDAHLRSDRSQGLSPSAFREWALGVAQEALEAVDGVVLDVPAALRTVAVRLDPEAGGGVHYEEPQDGRPGTMFRSVAPDEDVLWPWAERTTVHHESAPGHHVHSGAHAVDERLGVWRRHLGKVPGCNEGWALYAEHLAADLGLLPTPADRFGWLAARRWRLARVLVDLGVHADVPVPPRVSALPGASRSVRWDRATAGAFLRHHTVLSEGFLAFEVERQLGWPGQALAYALGERVWCEAAVAAGAASRGTVARSGGAGDRAGHGSTGLAGTVGAPGVAGAPVSAVRTGGGPPGAGADRGRVAQRAFHNRAVALGSVGLDLLARETSRW